VVQVHGGRLHHQRNIDMARQADGFGFETLRDVIDTLELRCEDCIEAGCLGCKHV
jgi:hypothetical protein